MKLLKKIGITILCLLLICGIGIVCLFHNEYSSLKSLKKIDAYPMYTMDYSADYGLDEFLEKGASNDKELVEFVVNHVMKGLPLSINIPDLGCSTFIAQNKDSGYLFGRNFDMDYSPSVLVKTKPKNGYASVSMVNLGFVGYNEKYFHDKGALYYCISNKYSKLLCLQFLLRKRKKVCENIDIIRAYKLMVNGIKDFK